MRYILFSLFLLATIQISAQTASLLQLNKDFYVSGEVIWFNYYLPNTFQDKTAVVKAVVSDKFGDEVTHFYLKSEGETFVEGYYKIPFNLSTNWYRLSMVSTADQRETIATIVFPVYNDLEGEKTATTNNLQERNLLPTDLTVEVQLERTRYTPRDLVQGEITIRDQNGQAVEGNVSISVQDAQLIKNQSVTLGKSPQSLAEQLTVEGTLLDENGTPMKASVLAMYSGLEERVFYSTANTEGRFNFKPPFFYGDYPVQFIGYQYEHEEVNIVLDKHKMPPITTVILYSKHVKDYLALSQQRKKIFQLYNSLETKLEPESATLNIQDLKMDFTYAIEEYESFEFMKDFFGELITPLKFILQKDSTYTATLSDPTGRSFENTKLSGKPLFIIDGKATRDANFVAKMDMDYIEEVQLMYEVKKLREKFSAIGRSGVVKIKTNLKNVSIPKSDMEDVFTLKGLQPKAKFPTFEPNAPQPIFLPQLYWQPNIKTDENGKATFSFYQSDDISTFKITVMSQGKNGQFGSGEQAYEVRMKQP